MAEFGSIYLKCSCYPLDRNRIVIYLIGETLAGEVTKQWNHQIF